jgi:tRNA G18 (ribose-2'-O)-methylase SpoU
MVTRIRSSFSKCFRQRKTALRAEDAVPWQHHADAREPLAALRGRGYEIAAIETSLHSVDLYEWRPAFPVCIVFGHEADVIRPELLASHG